MRIILWLTLVVVSLFMYFQAEKEIPNKRSKFVPECVFTISWMLWTMMCLVILHRPVDELNGLTLNDLELIDFPYVLIPLPTNNWEALAIGTISASTISMRMAQMMAYHQSKTLNSEALRSHPQIEGKMRKKLLFIFEIIGATAASIAIYEFFIEGS